MIKQWITVWSHRFNALSRCTRESLIRGAKFAALAVTVFTFAAFGYASFVYWYVPELLHVRQLNFLFETNCERINGEFCNFPSDNLTLKSNKYDELLTAGQKYVFLLDLEMPESPTNQNLGLFISTIQLYTAGGEPLVEASRASMLSYKSRLYQFVETLFFVYPMLFGVSQEKQTVTIRLLDNYIENVYKPTLGALFTLKVKQIELYSATLRIHAEFVGLRYVMFYWPIVSAICGIPMYAAFISVFTFIAWYAKSSRKEDSQSTNNQHTSQTMHYTSRTQEDNPFSFTDSEVSSNTLDVGGSSLDCYTPAKQDYKANVQGRDELTSYDVGVGGVRGIGGGSGDGVCRLKKIKK